MTEDHLPPLRRPEDTPPIRTQADLERHWRTLMGPLGFSERLLWVLLLAADGRVTPVLQQIGDLPQLPDVPMVDALMRVFRQICDELGNGSVAVLLSRPGRAGITPAERTWARRLTDAAAASGVRLWPVHVANDDELAPVTPNDLTVPRTAAG
ncbi:MAG: hypothetical protein H0V19_05955 [Euzebyales bacterium]|nr:hypothetical protein [Euzebyales bacterium]